MLDTLKGWLFALGLLIGGPVLVATGYTDGKAHKALLDHGQDANAVVTDIKWKEKRGSERDFKGVVTFTTTDGREIKATIPLPTDVGKALKNDQKLPLLKVRYLPESPQTARVMGDSDNSGLMMGIGAALGLLGAFLVWRKLRKPKELVAQAAAA